MKIEDDAMDGEKTNGDVMFGSPCVFVPLDLSSILSVIRPGFWLRRFRSLKISLSKKAYSRIWLQQPDPYRHTNDYSGTNLSPTLGLALTEL